MSCASHTEPPRRVRIAAVFARVAFALVFVVNVRCALGYIVDTAGFLPSFDASGEAGMVALRGIGVAFLMWNATYPAVIWDPVRFRSIAVVVLVQQVIGLVGEGWIYSGIPAAYPALQATIRAFISFDGFGLVIMLATFVWLEMERRRAAIQQKPGENPDGASSFSPGGVVPGDGSSRC